MFINQFSCWKMTDVADSPKPLDGNSIMSVGDKELKRFHGHLRFNG
jgi:hypothetical protein